MTNELWFKEARGYIRAKQRMECWQGHSVAFLCDLAALRFGLSEHQRLILHREIAGEVTI